MQLELNNYQVLSTGSHKGKIMMTAKLKGDWLDKTPEELKKILMNKEIWIHPLEKFLVKGVENVRFFVPGTPPEIGLLVEKINKDV